MLRSTLLLFALTSLGLAGAVVLAHTNDPPAPLTIALEAHEARAWELPLQQAADQPGEAAPPTTAATPRDTTALIAQASNGGRIVFTSYRDGRPQIYAMEADGSDQVNLSANSFRDYGPVVSSVPNAIAFLRCVSGTCTSHTDGNADVYVMDADGGNQRPLIESPHFETDFAWSPDGNWLAYSVYDAGEDRWSLIRTASDGHSLKRVLELCGSDPCTNAAWSHNGQRIYFNREGRFWSVPAFRTGRSRPESFGENQNWLRWSPDGSRVATAWRRGADNSAILVWDRADSFEQPIQVSPGGGEDSHPRWSPDGTRLLFDSNESGVHQLYVTMADGSTAGAYLNLSASQASDIDADWSARGTIAPAVAPGFIAHQRGALANPQIELYDRQADVSRVVVRGERVRLSGIAANRWIVYQQGNEFGGYDIWAHDLADGQARRLSAGEGPRTSNRPALDGAHVIWRQIDDPAGAPATVRFFQYDLVARARTEITVTGAYPERYSRYTAGDGALILIDEGGQLRVLDLDGGETTSLPHRPVLLSTVSEGMVAALERGPGGNDRLAVYSSANPDVRTEVAEGVAGQPVLGADLLAWVSGNDLYRFHLYEDLEPTRLTGEASAAAVDPGRAVTWLDVDGSWASTQAAFLPYSTDVEELTGAADWTFPAEEPTASALAPQNLFDWGDWSDWVAEVREGDLCHAVWSRTRRTTECSTRLFAFDRMAPNLLYLTAPYGRPTTKTVLRFRDGSYLTLHGQNFIRFRPSLTTHYDIQRELEAYLAAEVGDECIRTLVENLKDYYDLLESGQPATFDFSVVKRLGEGIETCSGSLAEAAEKRIEEIEKDGVRKAPRSLRTIRNTFGNTQAVVARVNKLFKLVDLALKARSYLAGELEHVKNLNDFFAGYLAESAVKEYNRAGLTTYHPNRRYRPELLAQTNELLLKMIVAQGGVAGERYPGECFVPDRWEVVIYTDGSYLFRGGNPDCQPVHLSRLDVAQRIARADQEALVQGVLAPLAEDIYNYYETVLETIFPQAWAIKGTAERVYNVYSSLTRVERLEVPERGRVRFTSEWDWRRKSRPKSLINVGKHGALMIWGTDVAVEQAADGSVAIDVFEGMPVLANMDATTYDAYALSSGDGRVVLPPGDWPSPLPISGRTALPQPVLLDISPSDGAAVPSEDLEIRLSFSDPMNMRRVEEHTFITITTLSGEPRAIREPAAFLGPYWDEPQTTLTLTALGGGEWGPGRYSLQVGVGPGVSTADGRRLAPLVASTTFEVLARVGLEGGTALTAQGVGLRLPPGAVSDEVQIVAAPRRAPSTPDGWFSSDGLVYDFGPDGLSFAVPVSLSLPAPRIEGVQIFHLGAAGWEPLGGQLDVIEGTIAASVTHLSTYAVFWPAGSAERPAYAIYVPAIPAPGYRPPSGAWEPDQGGIVFPNATFHDVSAVSTTDVWAVGANDTAPLILHFKGDGWHEVPSPRSPNGALHRLRALEMVTPASGWAVGEYGTIARYDGSAWQVVESPTEQHLLALDMLSADEGWAVGEGGVILHYVDGAWQHAISPTLEDLRAIAMLSPSEGWAVGEVGTVLRFLDGQWQRAPAATEHDLDAVDVVGRGQAWLAAGGTLLHFQDGIWRTHEAVSEDGFLALDMISGREGWAVGWAGEIVHFGDGSWRPIARPTDRDLLAVGMLSRDAGWAVGRGGTILRYR